MKKSYKMIIVLLILIPMTAVTVRVSMVALKKQSAKDQKMIEAFTGVWLGHSSVNQKLPELIQMGNTKERAKAYDTLIKEGYQNYMTEKMMKDFQGKLIAIPLELSGKYGDYRIQSTEVRKKGENYEVRVTLDPQGEKKPLQKIVFEVKTQRGKINWVRIDKGMGNK